jgi:predicted nucleic acid-binding protein
MSNAILDSSILIDCLRARADAVAFINALSASGAPSTHVMVVAELLAGARDKREQNVIDSFLASFHVVSSTEADALLALDLFRQYHLSHGVDWPDCLIAATALRLGVDVYTQNVKHFGAFAGLRALRAY